MNLPPLTEKFVLHFGEMGGRWGINRTVGQIYALLFLSDRPLNAEEMTEALGVSRSNVSMGLKELEAWRLVRKRHLPDDAQHRMREMHDVIELLLGWSDDVQTLDNKSLCQLLMLGAGVSKLLHAKTRVGDFVADKLRAPDRKD